MFETEVSLNARHRMHTESSIKSMEKSVNFVVLADGRRITYEEQGLGKTMAKRSLLVLHGIPSSRIAGMLGVSEDLLKEMGVRLVSIDRPGYGYSDFNQKQTYESVAKDIAQIADALELGEKFWLLGYSGGGPYCWAAAHFIPEPLAGIAMWAPVGNYQWKDISKTEEKDIRRQIKPGSSRWMRIVKVVPQWMLYAYMRYILVPVMGNNWVELL